MTAKLASRWPRSDSEMGERIRRHPWASTPLGAPHTWPTTLRVLLDTLLDVPRPMCILWGDHAIQLYNDAHARLLGGHHPAALGQPACEGWSASWPLLSPACDEVRRGQPRLLTGRHLPVERDGKYQEGWFDLSLSPIHGETDEVLGVLLCSIETTEQVRTEAHLSETAFQYKLSAENHRLSEERLQLALEASDLIGIWDWDLENGAVGQDGFSRFFQLERRNTPRDLPLEAFLDHILPEDRARVSAALQQCITEGGLFAERYRLRTGDGSERWAFARGRCHSDAHGRSVRFPGAVMDITRLHASEQALRKSEADLKRITDSLPVLIGYVDRDQRYRFCNRAYIDWFGVSLEWMQGRPIRELMGERAYALRTAQIDQALAGTPVTFEAYTPHRDGQPRQALVQYLPHRDAEDRTVGFHVLAMDVTERWKAEQALRESEQHLRAIIDLSPAMHWSTDERGHLTFASDRWLHLLGLDPEEALGRHWLEVIDEEAAAGLDPIWSTAQRFGQPFDAEQLVRLDSGETRWLRIRALPLHDEQGAVLRWHGTSENIHERRAAEQAMRELNETLESRIQDRTRALAEVYERLLAEMAKREQAQEALRQAQKMEAVGQLTGGIAHDFNNMLTGIIGSLDLIQHYIRTDRAAATGRFIEAAVTSANRAAALTHRLLAFSRRQPLKLKAVEVNGLIDSMRDLMTRTLGEQIRIVTDLAPDLPAAKSDENQLESALLNLVINARDAMPDGGLLHIATRETTLTGRHGLGDLPEGRYLILAVSDSGCGMSPKVLANAFEPFFTTKPIGQGTGLGLSMIYGFVRQTGGYVKLSSEVGVGTEISLYLPLHQAPAEAAVTAAEAPRTGVLPQGQTVLVVEDDAAVRLLVVGILQELGYRVLEAPDGKAAVALLGTLGPLDLLITDVGLPGMNGRQLADVAREQRPTLRVLFMTGYAEQAASAGFLEAGMDLIGKPFNIEALVQRIQGLLAV